MEYKFKIKEGQKTAYEELKEINGHDGMGIKYKPRRNRITMGFSGA